MKKCFVIAHDVGTSGVKSSLIGSDGTTVMSFTTRYDTHFEKGGVVYQNPDDWWDGVVSNTREITEHREYVNGIVGMGISGHMLGCLPVDRDGKTLMHHMLHSDARSEKQFEHIKSEVGTDAVYSSTGNILDPKAPLCKILWIKENKSDIYKNTYKFLQCKDYIVGKLTGNFDSTDYSDASHAQLLDVNTKEYSHDILKKVGIDENKLPHVYAGCDVVGKLTGEAADILGLKSGIPVVAGGGDGACANIGAGVSSPGDTYCCLGTTAWIASVSKKPYIDEKKRIFNIMTLDGENCGVFGTMQCAGRSIDYVSKLFDVDFKTFDQLSEGISPGSDGLIYLPYLEGERSPIFDFNARGVFFGMNTTHTRAHYYRACMEGVAYNLRVILDAFREKLDVEGFRLIGGGAKSRFLTGLIADVCGVPVYKMATPAADATSLGAAIAAFVGAGIYPDLDRGVSSIKIKETIVNKAETTMKYEPYLDVYKSLYPALKEVFQKASRL